LPNESLDLNLVLRRTSYDVCQREPEALHLVFSEVLIEISRKL